MRKQKIYLETTVWNFFFADDAPEKRDITKVFFQQLERYEIYTSDVVLAEINQNKSEHRKQTLLNLVSQYEPFILDQTEEIEQLALAYVQAGVLTQKHMIDARHIATAVVFDLDMIVSWNMGDIVKLKTRLGVNAVHRLNGYREIEIVSPQEITDYEYD